MKNDELLRLHLENRKALLAMRRKLMPPTLKGDSISATVFYFGTIIVGLLIALLFEYLS